MKPSSVLKKMKEFKTGFGDTPDEDKAIAWDDLESRLKLQDSDYPVCECGEHKRRHYTPTYTRCVAEFDGAHCCSCDEFIVRDPNLENAPKPGEDDIDSW
jgi:hypothetical protein